MPIPEETRFPLMRRPLQREPYCAAARPGPVSFGALLFLCFIALLLCAGSLHAFEARLVTATSTGTQTVTDPWAMKSLSMSGDGRLAVFEYAVLGQDTPVFLSEDGSAQEGIMLKDFETGKISHIRSYPQDMDPSYKGDYFYPVLSGNGRYIFFSTREDPVDGNTLPGDDSVRHIYRYDRETKAYEKVSILPSGYGATTDEPHRYPALSWDGRFALFQYLGQNIYGLFLRDMESDQTVRVDLRHDGSHPPELWSSAPWAGREAVSDDGRYVVFVHSDSQIVDAQSLGYDLSDRAVYLRDMHTEENRLLSRREDLTFYNWGFDAPAISGDGTSVVFTVNRELTGGNYPPLIDGVKGGNSLYRYVVGEDRLEFLAQNNLFRESFYTISRDGNVTAFASDADDLVQGDTNRAPDVFVKNLVNGQVIRVSVDEQGREVNVPDWVGPDAHYYFREGFPHFVNLSLSDDGRYVAFNHLWEFTNADTNEAIDAYRIDTLGYFYEPGEDPYAVVEESPTQTRLGLPDYRINTANLDMSLQGTLMRVPNRGPLLHLTLTRASKLEVQRGLFGKNWISNYEASIERLAGGYLAIWQGSGRRTVFSPPENYNPDNPGDVVEYRSPPGNFDVVTWNRETPNEEYITWWRRASRNTWRFDPATEGSVSYLTSITDRNDNKLTIDVDRATGRITKVTEPAGRSLTFQYDAQGQQCTKVTLTGGRSVSFAYNSENRLERITDMAGSVGNYQYDDDGNVTRMTRDSHWAEFTYEKRSESGDLGWYVTSLRDSETGVSRYEFTGHNPLTVKRTSRGGKVTRYQSANGQTTGIIDPLEGVTRMTYENRLPVSFTDRLGNQRRAVYDDRGNPTRVTDARGQSTVLEYNNDGLLTRRLNAEGERWLYHYDTKGNLTSVTSPENNITGFSYNSYGQLSKVTDPKEKETLYTHDAEGNLTSITDPLGKVTSFSYSSYRMQQITDPLGRAKVVAHDANDRLRSIRYGTGDDAPTVTFSHNAFGETGVTDERGRTWTVRRDRHGQVLRIESPLGQTWRRQYDVDGNLLYEIDPLGGSKRYGYDGKGNRTYAYDELDRSEQSGYSENDMLRYHVDRNDNTTRFYYNANDWLTALADPLEMHARTVYDDVGRVIHKGYISQGDFESLPRSDDGQLLEPWNLYKNLSRRLDQEYDGEGNLIQKSHAGTAITGTAYTYDAAGNLTEITGPAGTVSFGYDDAGRLTRADFPFSKQVTITYDAAGQIDTLTYPDGEIVSYAWQNRNLVPAPRHLNPVESFFEEKPVPAPAQMAWNTDEAEITFTYDTALQLTAINRDESVETSLEYDGAGRLTGITHDSAGADSMAVRYAYDRGDRTTSLELEGLLNPFTMTAGFEGEISEDNRLSAYRGAATAYDEAGNLITIGNGFSASYDHENRLISMTDGGIETSFDYTGDVLVKIESSGGPRYQAFIEGNLLFETDGDGALIASYFYAGDRLAAMRLHGEGEEAGLYYYLFDRNGNTLALVDKDGVIRARYGYLPYGHTTLAGAQIHNPFRYCGEWGILHENSRLYRMGRRHYDVAAGRFLQRDPAGFVDGSNLYRYAAGNPVDLIDPSGEIAISTVIVGAAVTIGVGKFLLNKLDDLITHGQELQDKRIKNLKRGAQGDSRAEERARKTKAEIASHMSNVAQTVTETFPGTTAKPKPPGALGSIKSLYTTFFGRGDEEEN